MAYAWLIGAVAVGVIHWPALIALLPALLSSKATRDVLRLYGQPRQLRPAIQMTIAAAMLHGLLLAGAIAFGGAFGWPLR